MAKDKSIELDKGGAVEKAKKAAQAAQNAKGNQQKQKKSIVKYFKDARSEFKKVVWPSRKQVVNNTIVVIVSLVVSGIAIWALDSLFAWLLMLMLGTQG